MPVVACAGYAASIGVPCGGYTCRCVRMLCMQAGRKVVQIAAGYVAAVLLLLHAVYHRVCMRLCLLLSMLICTLSAGI